MARSRCPGCRACRRQRDRSGAPAPESAPSSCRQAESATPRAARAWWQTGNSSGRALPRGRALRDRARVIDVLPGAAGALAVSRGTVVVELQRHADDIVALGLEQGRRDRGIDAARHGDDDADVPRGAFEIEAVEHCGLPARTFPEPYYRHWIGPPHAYEPRDHAPNFVREKASCLDAVAKSLPRP